MSDAVASVERFLGAFWSRDGAAAAAAVTEDLRLVSVPLAPRVLEGRDALRHVVSEAQLGFPGSLEDSGYRTVRAVAAGDIVMHERVDRFRFAGQWRDLSVAAVFEVRDGLVASETDYYDLLSYVRLMKSVGIDVDPQAPALNGTLADERLGTCDALRRLSPRPL